MWFKNVLVAAIGIVYLADAQQGVLNVSRSIDEFAIKLLAQTAETAGDSLNIALSPFTIWTLLTIISEGARGNTLRELENGLGLPAENKDTFRRSFRQLSDSLTKSGDGVSLDITNAIFATNEYPLNKTFQQISQSMYNVDVIPVDFKNTRRSANVVNSYIAKATRNVIPNFVNEDDMQDAAIFMTSTLFFKGEWKYPFNKTATRVENFYDESDKLRGKVQMMYQSGPFPYTLMSRLKAHAVELPYGDADRMSMIIFSPRKNEKVTTVLRLIAQTPLSEILDELARIEQEFLDEDVELSIPKFRFQSELNLNGVLSQMGFRDVFNVDRADLLGIFPQYLSLSRVLQRAVIDVDEEGTVATAAASGAFIYKTTQPKLVVNKPFAFLIVDKQMKTILFAGKISNPAGICDKCTGN